MTFDWYKIFNLQEFEDTGLVSREYTLELEGLGEKTILVTKGNAVGVLFEGVYMALELNGENPVAMDGYGVFLDEAGDVHVGVQLP